MVVRIKVTEEEMKRLDLTEHDFQFTRNWFIQRDQGTFSKFVYPTWVGKPITYLEIGVFQGQSMAWMFQKILTHPESKAVGIDPWLQMPPKWNPEAMEENCRRACHNLMPWRDRCELIRANSVSILRVAQSEEGLHGLAPGKVDLCMIDGEHGPGAVLDDACLVLPLMKKGGWILFDDVTTGMDRKKRPSWSWVTRPHVKDGLAMFLERHGDQVKQVFKHRFMEGYEVI